MHCLVLVLLLHHEIQVMEYVGESLNFTLNTFSQTFLNIVFLCACTCGITKCSFIYCEGAVEYFQL